MRNVKYIVIFEDNHLLDGNFDFKEEALDWAHEHLESKPIVKALDIEYSDEFGGHPIVHDEEELFHYPVEEVDEKELEAELDAKLADFEKEALVDPFDADEFDGHENLEEDTNKDVLDTIDDFINSLDDNKVTDESPVVTSKDVANTLDNFADDLAEDVNEAELAKDIPFEDPQEVIDEDLIIFDPFDTDFSECEPMDVCPDEHRADCCKDFNVNAVDFFKDLAIELGLQDLVDIKEKDVEEPVAVEDEVKVDVAPEAEVAAEEDVVPEEVKANEEPNVEVQVDKDGIEAPAEEISKCHVCPECGKELCECGNKELVEKNKVTYTTGDPAIGDAHFNGAFEGGEGVSENLEEESHPREAQPEVDRVEAFNKALEIAKKENKPVIYGYFGSDKHGGQRYFEIDHIVCDDLSKCTKDVMKQYNPSGAVMVAYPDKDFVEQLDEDLESEDIVLTEGPLGAIAKGIKGIGKGIAAAAKGVAKGVTAPAKALGNAVKNDFIDSDGATLDGAYKKYQVNCFVKENPDSIKEKKTFEKFKDADNFAKTYAKSAAGNEAYVFPMSDDNKLTDSPATGYVEGDRTDNNLKSLIKDLEANKAQAKADAKDEKARDKAASKLDAAAAKSLEGKADAEAEADAKAKRIKGGNTDAGSDAGADEVNSTKDSENGTAGSDAAEKPAEPAKPVNKRDLTKANNSKKLIKALNKLGINTDELITKYKDENGKEHTKGTDKLNQLRKELFGESLDEEVDEINLDDLDEEFPNCDLVNKDFCDEMSDEEFAEAFKKGLEEKHNNCK